MGGATIKGVVTLHCRLWHTGFIVLLAPVLVPTCCFGQNRLAASDHDQELNRQFQAAVAQYDGGHLPEAGAELEKLLERVPESFEAHELLGMVYAGESQDELANQQLETAVRLKPTSAAARTNLAASLIHSGDVEGARQQLKNVSGPGGRHLRRFSQERSLRCRRLPQRARGEVQRQHRGLY